MATISYREVVITCEACGKIKKMPVRNYEECLSVFGKYQCPNGCGRNMYSFFTVGRFQKKKK